MRNELEQIEIIEKYLRDELSAADKKTFEEQLKTDIQLQKAVKIQKEVIKGIERVGVKQSIQKAYKKYKMGKSGFNLGLGAIIIVAAVSAFLWYTDSNKTNVNRLPEFNEKGEKLWADADKYLESQKFTINTLADTVIETEGGIVMYIPKGSFLDENGQEITGEVEYEVKEALNTEQIIQGGLSSTSGDQLLESAGMFYVNARKNGTTVQINPGKGIYTEVPTDEVNPDMQLFEGKRIDDGSIDWVDPKPLDKFLTPVDIHSLNFYPPKYEPQLAELGKDASDSNKEYKDSLYYSFAWEEYEEDSIVIIKSIGEVPDSLLGREQEALEMGIIVRDSTKIPNNCNGPYIPYPSVKSIVDSTATSSLEFGIKSPYQYAQEEVAEEAEAAPPTYQVCGINPAKIKTIWSKEFSNTLIATREFEERLKTIFGTCNDAVLDLYINNMNLNLYEIDEMAASMTSGKSKTKFLEFASRKDGKVEIDDKRVKQLQKHYKQKQKLIAEAVAKTKQKFDSEQKKLDDEVQKERKEHYQTEIERKSDNFKRELELNLNSAYQQLGKKRPTNLRSISWSMNRQRYRTTILTNGWKNVDRYVFESTKNRETLDYTDPITGKKAVIKYEPISVSVIDEEKYDRVFVYILPDQLNSFMRMKKQENKYTEKLNELMKNSLICLAYMGEQTYFYVDDNVAPKEHNIKLTKMSQNEMKQKLRKYGRKQNKNLLKELDYQLMEVKESKRQEFLANREQFRNEIMQAIFPCFGFDDLADDSTVVTEEAAFE